MNDELLNLLLRVFVIETHADPEPPTDDEIADDVARIRAVSYIETTPIDATPDDSIFPEPARAFLISFRDECEIKIIAFVDDTPTVTHAMISADYEPYIPMNIDNPQPII